MKQIKYSDARKIMSPGDVLAFGGRGILSTAIKFATNCPVSHVGVIMQVNIPTLDGIFINQIIESTSLGDGFAGVQISRVSDHIRDYDGEIWCLPLSTIAREDFDQGVFFGFLLDQVGKKYDIPQAIGSALDFIPDNKEDLDKLFCSELVTAAFEKIGIIGEINASEQTPKDVIEFPLYDEPYQLKGKSSDLF